jgi:hypothetical protein
MVKPIPYWAERAPQGHLILRSDRKVEFKTDVPSDANRRSGTTALGYTKQRGVPSDLKMRVVGPFQPWRRVRYFCVSNIGSYFVMSEGHTILIPSTRIP